MSDYKIKESGLARLLPAFKFSVQGIKRGLKDESAFRLELWLLLAAVILAPVVSKSLFEWLLLIAVVVLILIVELINSAIEAVVDRIGTEFHDLSGAAKDYGSAAVLFSSLLAALTWLTVLAKQLLF